MKRRPCPSPTPCPTGRHVSEAREMVSYLVVFVGAGIGGAARHGMNIWVARLMGTHFPWHTLLINILGSIVMGVITGWFAERFGAAGHLRLFLATGIMGGFT